MIKLNSLKLIMVGNSNTEKIENYCANHHIKKKKKIYSPPYNPQNNCKAERFSYTLENCIKTLLCWSMLDIIFWNFEAIYANFFYNNTPHKGKSNNISNELFYNKKIFIKYFKTFGCIAHYIDFFPMKK